MSNSANQPAMENRTNTKSESASFVNIFTLPKNQDLILKLKDLSSSGTSKQDIIGILDKVEHISERLNASIKNVREKELNITKIENNLSDFRSKISDLLPQKELLSQEIEALKSGDTSTLPSETDYISEEILQTFIEFKEKKSSQLEADIHLFERRANYEERKLLQAEKKHEEALIKHEKFDDSAHKILTNLKKIKLFLEKEAIRSKIEAERREKEEENSASLEESSSDDFLDFESEESKENKQNADLELEESADPPINADLNKNKETGKKDEKNPDEEIEKNKVHKNILSSPEYKSWRERLDRSHQNLRKKAASTSPLSDSQIFNASSEDIKKYAHGFKKKKGRG